jgi:hypothetical protein
LCEKSAYRLRRIGGAIPNGRPDPVNIAARRPIRRFD